MWPCVSKNYKLLFLKRNFLWTVEVTYDSTSNTTGTPRYEIRTTIHHQVDQIKDRVTDETCIINNDYKKCVGL